MEKSDNCKCCLVQKGSLEYIQFSNLLKHRDILTHCFTTRNGGVSEGDCFSLNLGLNRKDLKENVIENFKRVSDALGIDYKNFVFSNQVHDNKIKIVDESDRGKGLFIESNIIGYDGLVTNKKQVALVTFYADCVPIFFFDPLNEVIALAHSGWRGTVKEIGAEVLSTMKKNFGSQAEDIEVVIGPSIGDCCFEVGEEVYREFIGVFPWSCIFCKKTGEGKWHIHLQEIIKRCLVLWGLAEDKVLLSEMCTKCNSDTFFSYRGSNGKTGVQAAIMQLL
ncbi:MAG: peptidoglycan editing factor PgeF [Clostridia bacterium]|nr:peptidoglycan editing factor PgeF [Clostridia bacterium]